MLWLAYGLQTTPALVGVVPAVAALPLLVVVLPALLVEGLVDGGRERTDAD